jgi:predicted phosphodiesterase
MKTFKEDYDTLRFDVYNDIHGKDSILQVLMSSGRKNIDFAALNGDMTSNIESPEMVQTMYLATTAANLGGTTPLFASRGNHELRGKDAIRWFDYFETPTGYTYYTFRLGKFFFIVLDACEDKPDDAFEYSGTVISEGYLRQQEAWLKSVIESDEFRTAEVKLAFCHIPPETKGWFGNVNVCRYFVPHLNKGGLDAMFCGHIHKWRYDEVGCGISDAEFPVVCLPNACRSEITATSENVMLEVYSPDGDRINSLEIKF